MCADWRAFGAASDWICVAFTNWAIPVGTSEVDSLRVFSFGKIESLVREADNPIAAKYWFAPFTTPLGIVPQANWDWLNQDPDGDGLPTIDELFAFDTNPRNPDTDCDGLSDRDELLIYGDGAPPVRFAAREQSWK